MYSSLYVTCITSIALHVVFFSLELVQSDLIRLFVQSQKGPLANPLVLLCAFRLKYSTIARVVRTSLSDLGGNKE